MPRKVLLTAADLNYFTAISAEFGMVVEDGDLIVPDTTVRRAITPDQDINQNCDDLDAYFATKGYPSISEADRATLHAIRTAADANPEMVARKDKWLEEQAAQAAAMAPPVEGEGNGGV